jgi:hypothetical protein
MTSLPPQSLIAAVERAVGQLPSQWEKLLGGRSNALWRGRTGGADLVVKLYLPSGATPLFPNDPAAEYQILQGLGPLGLAPEALAHIHGDFGSALQARLGGVEAERASEGAVKYRIPTMASLDGNTVEMATEQTAFAENAVAYTATLNFLRGRVETVTRAIRGE